MILCEHVSSSEKGITDTNLMAFCQSISKYKNSVLHLPRDQSLSNRRAVTALSNSVRKRGMGDF